MNNLDYILKQLIDAMPEYKHIQFPADIAGKRNLMRSLINVLPPQKMSEDFLKSQNEELLLQQKERGVVDVKSIQTVESNPCLKIWQGDITRLNADAIVNAANNQLLGCFIPLHGCIDNAIHSAAGVQLRQACHEIMKRQKYPEQTGSAKITSGYNLPAKYVIHTVGPIIRNEKASAEKEKLLANCYLSCLQLAAEKDIKSLAFCCISTGEFRFPNQRAAEIAVDTVSDYFESVPDSSLESVIFNVYKDLDFMIYTNLLK